MCHFPIYGLASLEPAPGRFMPCLLHKYLGSRYAPRIPYTETPHRAWHHEEAMSQAGNTVKAFEQVWAVSIFRLKWGTDALVERTT